MDAWIQTIVTVFCSVLASSGFWAYIMKRQENKSDRTKLLVGLAHDRICSLGESYLARGWITADEYENFYDYLYLPYKACGGNGTAERIVEAVKKLPVRARGESGEN